MTLEDIVQNPSLLDSLRRPTVCACGCGQAVAEAPGEVEAGPDGRAWRTDCHWRALGEGLERHPIVSGGTRRG